MLRINEPKLLTLGVMKALTKCCNNETRFRIKNAAKGIAGYGLLAFLLLFFIGMTKAFATPEREALNEEIKFDSFWVMGQWTREFDLFEQPRANGLCSVVELSPLISIERQPVPQAQADKEGEEAEQHGVTLNDWMDLLKKHGMNWILMFFAGLVTGGAFGWPPFTADRPRKPARRLS